MPQMDVVPFNNPQNFEILNAIRSVGTSDYQNRVPAATKASIDDALNAMWSYSPARNQFTDALVNLIGSQIMHYNTWTNPLAKFKRGQMNMGETVEEVAVGLLQAKHYNPDAAYLENALFGREPTEVQTRFHKIDRQDMYKVTINRNMLRRAFLSPNGLSEFITAQMASISTSDDWDEFLITASLLRKYYDQNGFYKVNVPDVSNLQIADAVNAQNDAKFILRKMRAMAETLPFLSRDYNAAKMPMSARPENLELFMTPETRAVVDVDGLSAAFNVDKADFNPRTTIIPSKYIGIPGFQALLTTREFFLIMDQFMDMQSANNPAGVYTNFFWHHHELISASAFVPAILYTSADTGNVVTVQSYPVTGITALTVLDLINNDVPVTNSTLTRGGAYLVQGTAITNPAGGPNNGLTLSLLPGKSSSKTRITQEGVLIIGIDEASTTLTVHAVSTYDDTFYLDTTFTITGSLLEGSIGQNVDDSPTTINNLKAPQVTPGTESVASGQSFTVDNGRWDTKGLTYTYQWQANGSNISGATTDTYQPVTGNIGQTITCVVTAAKTGYANATAVSTAGAVTA